MPQLLTSVTLLQCSMGAAPSVFVADELPGMPKELGLPAATILETVPGKNILPFGVCSSMANPTVAAATAAAQGVLTPMPCLPAVITPWAPPSICTKHLGVPLAHADGFCTCGYGGMIKVSVPNPIAAKTI